MPARVPPAASIPIASRLALSLVLALCACASPARAEHGGHGGPHSARNRASFQVEAVREIPNDWTTARLSVVAEGKEPAFVAKTVNEAMEKAVARAKRARGVEVQTGSYTTHPIYDDGRVVRWRASQELRLESGEVDALAKLIGDLQNASVLLSGMDFSVRRETRKALEDKLIQEALSRFRARADLIAKGMAAKSWSLIDVSVGTTNAAPHRVYNDRARMQSFAEAAVAPTLEAGTSEVRVHASGVVELD